MSLPESRICGNVYDKIDNPLWMQAQEFKDVPRTVYFDVDEVVYIDKKYFNELPDIEINNWNEVFG